MSSDFTAFNNIPMDFSADRLMASLAEDYRNKALPGIAAEVALDSTADRVCERLFEVMQAYDKTLDKDSELGMHLVSFGVMKTITVATIGPIGPNLICFRGYSDGKEVALVQHVSQLSFLLCSVPKEPDRPRRTIGFQPWEEEDSE